jgi:Ca2+/Na+ antiporter
VNTKLITSIVMAFVTLGLIGYDIWVAIEPTSNDTISEILGSLSIDLGIVAYAWGVLTSHLLIHRNSETYGTSDVRRYVYLSIASVAALLFSIYGPTLQPVGYLLFGAISGWAWWPQFKQNLK